MEKSTSGFPILKKATSPPRFLALSTSNSRCPPCILKTAFAAATNFFCFLNPLCSADQIDERRQHDRQPRAGQRENFQGRPNSGGTRKPTISATKSKKNFADESAQIREMRRHVSRRWRRWLRRRCERTVDHRFRSNLSFLNDASVLYVLRARYGAMLIYVRRRAADCRNRAVAVSDLLGPLLRRHQSVQAAADLHRLGGSHVHGQATVRRRAPSERSNARRPPLLQN